MLATGLFSKENPVIANEYSRTGVLHGGNWGFVGAQLIGILAYTVWGLVAGGLFVWVFARFVMAVRMTPEEEIIGSDVLEHNLISMVRVSTGTKPALPTADIDGVVSSTMQDALGPQSPSRRLSASAALHHTRRSTAWPGAGHQTDPAGHAMRLTVPSMLMELRPEEVFLTGTILDEIYFLEQPTMGPKNSIADVSCTEMRRPSRLAQRINNMSRFFMAQMERSGAARAGSQHGIFGDGCDRRADGSSVSSISISGIVGRWQQKSSVANSRPTSAANSRRASLASSVTESPKDRHFGSHVATSGSPQPVPPHVVIDSVPIDIANDLGLIGENKDSRVRES